MTAVALHTAVEGPPDAPVVLLLNSLGSTLHMWDPQVPALAEHFRVVRCDARGHGRSPAPPAPYALDDLVDDALAVLDGLGVARAHVVGLSLGGATALRLAVRAPERVDRLALLCTSAFFGGPGAWRERAAAVRADGTSSIADAVVSRWLTPEHAEADPGLVERLRDMVAGSSDEGYAACCEVIAGLDQRPDLTRVTAPTLALAGAEDPATPPPHLAEIAAGVPGAQLLVVPGATHLANLDQPVAVSAALLVHLRSGATSAAQGMAVRRAVLGDAHVDRAVAGSTALTAPFQDLITRYAWGDVWSRPGLDRRTRSMVTLALLTALGHEHELALHVRAALRNGVAREEIGEVLLHSAVYAGVPAANRMLAVAQRVLDEVDAEGGLAER